MSLVFDGSTNSISGLANGGLPDGCILDADINAMAASKLTGALPAISGASLTNLPSSGGITQADQWRLSAYVTVSSETILTSNWERNDTSFAYIGSGMSESSGIFTFPATGIYLVMGFFYGYGNGGGRRYLMNRVFGTTDNSNYVALVQSVGSCSAGGEYTNGTAQTIFDVTDVTTHKIQMRIDSDVGASVFLGNSSTNTTGITFIRLGDT